MSNEVFSGPWYPWYVDDVLTSEDVETLSLTEEGAYRRALDKAWKKGSIPADPKRCADVIGKRCTAKIAARILEMFVPVQGHPSRMVNLKQERVRAEQKEKYEKKSKSGKAGARNRWHPQPNENAGANGVANGNANGGANASAMQDIDLETEDSTKRESKEASVKPTNEPDPVQERIWKDGTDLLTRSGLKNGSARSFLGKQAKEYGSEPLAEAIAAALAKNAADPKAYIVAALQKRGNEAAQVGKFTGNEKEYNCSTCFDLGTITNVIDNLNFKEMPCPKCAAVRV